MIYIEVSYDAVQATDSYTYLGSYSQYNDANRAYNAKQFVKAWNNTIIPLNSTSSGMDTIGFYCFFRSKSSRWCSFSWSLLFYKSFKISSFIYRSLSPH